MKIIQLCPYAMDRAGGVQRHVRDLSAWLTAQGHETRIIAPPAPGKKPQQQGLRFELGRARTLSVHGTGFEISAAMPWNIRTMAHQMRTWGADLAHLHTPWTPMLVGQMWKALRLPSVTTIHATLPTADGAGLIDRYIRRSARLFLRASAAVIVPSPAPLGMLQDLLPTLRARILPPCVDLSGFHAAQKTPQSFLFLGRLEPRKGLNVVLEAWPSVAQALPNAQLTIAGDGPLRDHLPTGTQIRHIPQISDPDVVRLMAEAEVFFAPATFGESYGLVLAEAMAAQALPLAAANAGYAHVLRDVPKLLVRPGNAAHLSARAIELATSDTSQLREKVAQLALQSDVGTVAPDYLALYHQVLSRDGPHPTQND